MKRSTKKLISILCVAFFILSIAVPAFAASKNRVVGLLEVEDGHPFNESNAPYLRIEEESDDFGDVGSIIEFELRLENAKWLKDANDNFIIDSTLLNAVKYIEGATVKAVSFYGDKILSLKIEKTSNDVVVKIPLITKVDGEGDVKVEVVPQMGRITAGTYVFAVSGKGATVTTLVGSAAKFFRDTDDKLATIRVEETRAGALGSDSQNIKMKLPPKYSWADLNKSDTDVDDFVTFSSALGTVTNKVLKTDGRELELTFKLASGRDAKGSVFFDNLKIIADRNAPFGDVVVDVDGNNVTSEEVVVAKHLDYDVEISVKEVKELIAGRAEEKTAEIKIKENFSGSLIRNRDIDIVLPKWVKISNTDEGVADGNELYINVTKGEYKFKLDLSIEADKAGDIVAEISGAGIEKQEVVIAKAVAPITAEVAAADLKIGVQNQAAPDIVITETKKGAIEKGDLTITLPKGIKFASTPEAEVDDEGNLEIKKAKLSTDDEKLIIEVKSTSTKPSTIKISDIKLTLDRTVPEGEFKAAIGGNAVVKNEGDKDPKFKTDYVVKFVFANVITPAPGETRATSIFTIGGTTYTVMEQNTTVEKTMDVAPYIKDGRTFLPLRYVANALGVNDDNIIWDPVTKAVTIFKGDRIAQVTIGSKTMLVNGVTVNMDVAPEITDERTMLPIRWMGQALGATIDWDAEARSVTVKQ